jgi:hypothetical protein
MAKGNSHVIPVRQKKSGIIKQDSWSMKETNSGPGKMKKES